MKHYKKNFRLKQKLLNKNGKHIMENYMNNKIKI